MIEQNSDSRSIKMKTAQRHGVAQQRAGLLVGKRERLKRWDGRNEIALSGYPGIALAPGQDRQRRAGGPGAFDQRHADFIGRRKAILRGEACPQFGELVDRDRMQGDADLFELAVEVAAGRKPGGRRLDVVGAEHGMVVQHAHRLAEQLVTEGLSAVVAAPERRQQVIEIERQRRERDLTVEILPWHICIRPSGVAYHLIEKEIELVAGRAVRTSLVEG